MTSVIVPMDAHLAPKVEAMTEAAASLGIDRTVARDVASSVASVASLDSYENVVELATIAFEHRRKCLGFEITDAAVAAAASAMLNAWENA